jgi:hypothetical protein
MSPTSPDAAKTGDVGDEARSRWIFDVTASNKRYTVEISCYSTPSGDVVTSVTS